MIRMTWGNDRYLRQINATLLFVVGRFPNLKVQYRLEQEGRKYQDLLQGDFFEDYFLLAYKSLTWLLWTKTKCSKVGNKILRQKASTSVLPRFLGLSKQTTI